MLMRGRALVVPILEGPYEAGHNLPVNELIKETIDWFDRHLGPVR